MIEGELVDCTNEFIIGNLAVSPIDSKIAVEIAIRVRMPHDPLGEPVADPGPGAVGSKGMPQVMEMNARVGVQGVIQPSHG